MFIKYLEFAMAQPQTRMTRQRAVILEELRKVKTHPTADELYSIVPATEDEGIININVFPLTKELPSLQNERKPSKEILHLTRTHYPN